jgi:CRP/FNR family transcriptional regulator
MGRADIADFLGLTIETVSRTFTSLKKDGMIELEPGNHVRLRVPRLQELSGDWY